MYIVILENQRWVAMLTLHSVSEECQLKIVLEFYIQNGIGTFLVFI